MKLFINNNPQSSLAIQFKFSLQDLKENEFGFEWEEEWKEFNYKGVMYDIIHSTINKDSISKTRLLTSKTLLGQNKCHLDANVMEVLAKGKREF